MNYEKKYHNKVFQIADGHYNFPLTLIVGDYEFYKEYLNKRKIIVGAQKNWGAECFVLPNKGRSYIWIPKIDFCSVNYGVLGHEILHIAINVMKHIGFKLRYNNTEPLNYYFEYLLSRTLLKLGRHLRKK